MKKLLLTALLGGHCMAVLHAQLPTQKWAIKAQAFHQDWGINIDFGSLAVQDRVSIRPGFSAGVERNWHTGKRQRFRLSQDVQVGLWNNTYVERYAAISSRISANFRLWKGLNIGTSAVYGIGRVKPTDIRYIYENEKWVPSTNSTPAFTRQEVGLGAQVSWLFGPNAAHPIEVMFGGDYLLGWKLLPVESAGNLFLFKRLRLGASYYF